MSKINF